MPAIKSNKAKKLYQELDAAQSYIERVAVLDRLAFHFLNADIRRCDEIIDEMLQMSNENNYTKGIALAYNAEARVLVRLKEYKKGIIQFNKALKTIGPLNDTHVEAMIYDGLSIAYSDSGDYEHGISNAEKAFERHKKNDDPLGLKIVSLNNIGNSFVRMGDDMRAERYYKLALTIVEEEYNGDKGTNVRANIALLYLKQGRFQEALDTFKQCMTVFVEMDHKNAMGLTNMHIGDAYTGLNNYADAVNHYIKAITQFKQSKNYQTLIDAYLGLAKLYVKLGGNKQALEQLEHCEVILNEHKLPQQLQAVHELKKQVLTT